MKYLTIVALLLITTFQACFSQKTLSSPCECEHLNTRGEERFYDQYKNNPYLVDYVKSNIMDSVLLQYVGKKSDYIKLNQKYCSDSMAIYTKNEESERLQVSVIEGLFLMSEHQWTYDTIGDPYREIKLRIPYLDGIKSTYILGIQPKDILYAPGYIEKQRVVTEIKLEWNGSQLIIPMDEQVLLFNSNFCKLEKPQLKPIEIYDIGNDKLAIYIHGNPRYPTMQYFGNHIAKIIVDKKKGYIGTIFLRSFELKMYGWMRCENFQGF